MRTDSSPSEISSSEMPDSSSSSISFFTLRISIREPLCEFWFLRVSQAGACGDERKLVAQGSQSDDAADRDVGQIRTMSKFLARKQVAQMNFDERYRDPEKGVAQGNAGVGESPRIDDHEGDAVALDGVNLRDQLMLGIALEAREDMAPGLRKCLQ